MSFRERIDELVFESAILGVNNPGICECCERQVDLIIETPSRTFYTWDGEGLDPNRSRLLCEWCSWEYSEQIEAQWAEYWEMTR